MSARPHETHIPIGPLIAAIGGVLLIVSLGLDWYGRFSAFTAFEVWDLVLVVLAPDDDRGRSPSRSGCCTRRFGPEPGWRSGRPR